MNILLQKLYNRYERYSPIGKVIGFATLDNLKSGSLPRLSTFYKKIDLEKEIGYTYEDFLLDYHSKIVKFKEVKAVYNIWCMGLTINEYASMKGLSSQLYNILKKGRSISQTDTLKNISDILEFDITFHDLEGFEVILNPNFCKLIGNIDALEKFKEKYSIPNPILKFKDSYQLAFNEVIIEKIREIIY